MDNKDKVPVGLLVGVLYSLLSVALVFIAPSFGWQIIPIVVILLVVGLGGLITFSLIDGTQVKSALKYILAVVARKQRFVDPQIEKIVREVQSTRNDILEAVELRTEGRSLTDRLVRTTEMVEDLVAEIIHLATRLDHATNSESRLTDRISVLSDRLLNEDSSNLRKTLKDECSSAQQALSSIEALRDQLKISASVLNSICNRVTSLDLQQVDNQLSGIEGQLSEESTQIHELLEEAQQVYLS